MSSSKHSFDRTRKTIGFFLAPILLLLFYTLPTPGLSRPGHALLAILVFTITLWVTEALPIPITSILGPVLVVIFGVGGAKEVFAPFSDPIIMLFLGGFILAEAMSVHGLDRRFALMILSSRAIARHSQLIVLGFGAIVAFISMWISNTATTAMMFPIALGLVRTISHVRNETLEESDHATDPFAVGIFLIAAYMSSIGGIGTPIGSPTNLIGIGMLNTLANIKIPFLTWMQLTVPIMLVLFSLTYLYFIRICPPPRELSASSHAYFLEQRKALGPLKRGEINAVLAFLTAVTLWIYPGILAMIAGTKDPHYLHFMSTFPEGVVALLAATLLFVLPVNWEKRQFTLTMKQALNIDWGTLLLVGGALSLGNLMFKTGVAKALSDALVAYTGVHTLFGITALAVFLSLFITQTTSNVAVANMMVPLVIAISATAQVNPIPPVLGATLGSSMAFMLPSGTAPNALIYGSGLVPITKMIRHGAVISVLSYGVILLGSFFLPQLLGLV